jgi:hypothetical protein
MDANLLSPDEIQRRQATWDRVASARAARGSITRAAMELARERQQREPVSGSRNRPQMAWLFTAGNLSA